MAQAPAPGGPAPAQASSSSATAPPPSSSKAVAYPTRPGYGKFGDARANQLVVEVAAARDQHNVLITPEVAKKKINREVIKQFVRLSKESQLGKRMPAYGGMKNIYTAAPLPVGWKDSVVKLAEKDGQEGSTAACSKRFFPWKESHGTTNIAFAHSTAIIVAVDSRISDFWGSILSNSCPKLHWVYGDIYMTMNGETESWWSMFERVCVEMRAAPLGLRTVQKAALTAYEFVWRAPAGALVVGWDSTSPHQQIYNVMSSPVPSQRMMMGGGQWPAAAGSGSDHLSLRGLPADGTRAAEFVRDLLDQAALNDPYTGGHLWVFRLRRGRYPKPLHYGFAD